MRFVWWGYGFNMTLRGYRITTPQKSTDLVSKYLLTIDIDFTTYEDEKEIISKNIN